MKRVLLIGAAAFMAVLLAAAALCAGGKAYDGGIMYSWHMSALKSEGKEKLLAWAERLRIRTVYQTFDNDFLKAGDDSFLAELSGLGIEVLHLNGTPEWAFRPDSMKAEIDQVLKFNAAADTPISGIVFDVEPHASEEYKEPDDYIALVSSLKQAYAHARENGLRMVVVIPYWLERLGGSLLPDIIGSCSDEVSVMNYYTSETAAHIAEELALAKRHGKPISTIYELDFGRENTFDSMEQALADFEEMYETYGYEELQIAYHHLGDL